MTNLSDLMLEGIKGHEQLTNGDFVSWEDEQLCKSDGCCALGAAGLGAHIDPCELVALGDNLDDWTYFFLDDLGIDLEEKATHPVEKWITSLESVITSLNDNYEWSVEQIAEWLKTIGK